MSARVLVSPATVARLPFLQAAFVTVYASCWFTTVILPGIGRPERILTIVGLLGVPFATAASRPIAMVPPAMVSLGIIGMLVSYAIAYMSNAPANDAADYILALTSRAVFLWLAFVHLQNRTLLDRAVKLLAGSSLAAAAFATLVMVRYGVGAGRVSLSQLYQSLGPYLLEIFAAAQWATVGGILLIGLAPRLKPHLRRLAPLGAIAIFVIAYMTYFRRQFLITAPLVLGSMLLTYRTRRANAAFVALVFVGLVGFEYTREQSLLRNRLMSEAGGSLMDAQEMRLTTAMAQWQAIEERPATGFGPGNHARALSSFMMLDQRFLSGYNIYGWLAVEGGVFCLFFYLLILLGVMVEAWRNRMATGDTPESVVLRCGPVLVLQIALWGIFGNAWESPVSWFVLGMILAAGRVAAAEEGDQPSAHEFRASVVRAVTAAGFRGAAARAGGWRPTAGDGAWPYEGDEALDERDHGGVDR